MNYGPIVFLAAFFALASSWYTFVVKPQFQIGRMLPTNSVPAGVSYPTSRPGLAQQGLQVYRENGCYYCHSQQVVQEGAVFEIILREVGTNQAALETAIKHLNPQLAAQPGVLENLPKPVLAGVGKAEADRAVKLLKASSGQADQWIMATGPDIERGWGQRRSVAEDFLYDNPAMLGSQRIGPDLANIGGRQPDLQWHLRHLYAPKAMVKDSVMPPYKFLFEERKMGPRPSPNALQNPEELGAKPGYEIVPRPEAVALANYMISLKSDVPLYSAPFSVAAPPPAEATNAPASTTNQTTTPTP